MQLHDKVVSSGYEYDTLVGIAAGGLVVAREFPDKEVFAVTCGRKGSKVKKGGLEKVLGNIPQWISSFLRMAESGIGEIQGRFCGDKNPALRDVEIDGRLRERLAGGRRKVLVVDDAADSGRTLLSVKDALQSLSPESEVRTAVITQTRSRTVLPPDYTVYNDNTLIRFPWAPDFRQR